ncbi:MAG: hypothetical protein Q4C71_06360, partial [Microbacteriaceae bacterium]|nr:hypothetical protein [Microbacteriaceae bacterium]
AGRADTPAMQVRVQRSVRYNRLLIFGAAIGAILAVSCTMLFPVAPEGHYTLPQVVGFMAVLGAAAGLLAGGIFGLIIGAASRKNEGTATVVRQVFTAETETDMAGAASELEKDAGNSQPSVR